MTLDARLDVADPKALAAYPEPVITERDGKQYAEVPAGKRAALLPELTEEMDSLSFSHTQNGGTRSVMATALIAGHSKMCGVHWDDLSDEAKAAFDLVRAEIFALVKDDLGQLPWVR